MKTTSHVSQRNPNTVVSLNKKDHGVKIQRSLGRWSNAKSFQYQLQHKREDHSPHCIYAMVHHTTDPASKVTLEMFTHHSGDRAWKLTLTKNLIPTVTPFPVTYECTGNKLVLLMYVLHNLLYMISNYLCIVIATPQREQTQSVASYRDIRSEHHDCPTGYPYTKSYNICYKL